MNKIQVTRKLAYKHENWVKSIEDEDIQEAARNSFFTGGCINSLLEDEQPNDYDLYFTDRESLVKVLEYYAEKWNNTHDVNKMLINFEGDRVKISINSANGAILNENAPKDVEDVGDFGDVEEAKKDRYKPVFVSPNALTLSDGIQIVVRFYGTPAEVHKNFDYVHCTNYFEPSSFGVTWVDGLPQNTGKLVLNVDALASLMTKELRYIGSRYPIASLFRLRKFIAKGYTVNVAQILKIVYQIGNFDLYDPKVLEDQLVGVDLVFMGQFIEKVREAVADNTKAVDSTAMVQVLDEIFEDGFSEEK